MKMNRLLGLSLLLMPALVSQGQTVDDFISQGRAFLSVSNLVGANSSFSNAVVLSPANPTANVFYGVTRLLVWPNQPAGSNFLTRLGVPASGRNLYHWKAMPPTDTNGVVLVPTGVNASEATALLRTNFLPALVAAEGNLAKVADTNFTLTLNASETLSTAVTLDYGDVQLLRAFLQAAEYWCYILYEWNLDSQLTAIQSFAEGQVSFEEFLRNHPQLFTFATTNDLNSSKVAFLSGVNRYFEASQWIRSRPTNVVRLFNADVTSAYHEAGFRTTLSDLTNSLTQAVTLQVQTNYMVHLGSLFEGRTTLRSLLPTIRGNGFALGTLPDPTFGGLVYGVTSEDMDGLLAKTLSHALVPIPTISAVFTGTGPQIGFSLNVARERGYVVQVSTNLTDWKDESAFFALGSREMFTDPSAAGAPRRFYRLVDRTANMPPPLNSSFDSRISLSGLGVATQGYYVSAQPGIFWSSSTVWWTWTAPVSGEVVISTQGSTAGASVTIYTGSSTNDLVTVAYGDQPFDAVAGTTYQIAVSGWGPLGGIRLTITAPPEINLTSPMDGAALTAPTDILFQASASDPDGSVTDLKCYVNGNLLAGTDGRPLSFLWTNVPPGYYNVQFRATDNLGVTSVAYRYVRVRPANDDFADRAQITGVPATVTGSNAGGSVEPGEPLHGGNSTGASIWWTWTAPSSGPITMTADLKIRASNA